MDSGDMTSIDLSSGGDPAFVELHPVSTTPFTKEHNMSQSSKSQRVGAAGNEVMKQVQQWLAEGRSFAWMPIYSRANYPNINPLILQQFDQCRDQDYWLVAKVEDFLQIPEGVSGWLLPMGESDTDIVAAVAKNEVCFSKVIDRRNGKRQTLLTGKNLGPAKVLGELRKVGGHDEL